MGDQMIFSSALAEVHGLLQPVARSRNEIHQRDLLKSEDLVSPNLPNPGVALLIHPLMPVDQIPGGRA